LRSSLFWDVTQRRWAVTDVSGQPIGPSIKGQAVQDTSVTTNIPKERRSDLHSGGNLK